MKCSLYLAVLYTCFNCLAASAAIINIPADYPTIQQGINAGSDGDTVLVQPGNYDENIRFNGHNIVLGSLFLTTGDTSYISQTSIDGNMAGTVVTFNNGEDSTAVITGFTIRNGFAFEGGGIACNYADPVITNNRIIENRAEADGGGIFCANADPLIQYNTIEGNRCHSLGGAGIACFMNSCPLIRFNIVRDNRIYDYGHGAGILCQDRCQAIIVNNLVTDNKTLAITSLAHGGGVECRFESDALVSGNIITGNQSIGNPGWGGGVECFQANPIVCNNIIIGNSATSYGGGIAIIYADPTICHNLVVRNSSDSLGGGIFCSGGEINLLNNTFTENSARYYGGGFSCNSSSYPEIVNSIFWGDSAGVGGDEIYVLTGYVEFTYCDIEGGWSGTGNIDTDPLFRDSQNGNFRLMDVSCGYSFNSPCIDLGDPSITDNILDCDWGLGTQRSDMGKYGGDADIYTAITDHELEMPNQLLLMQNYPNPFNVQTTIGFVLIESDNVQLTVYDLLGRQVITLINEYRQAGTYSVNFDASGFSSGVYFYRLRTGMTLETKRMVLLK